MAIEAPISRYKNNNSKIAIFACVVFAIIFAYDGYLSRYEWSLRRSFYEKHVKDGKPDDTMIFNRTVPFCLVAIAALLALRLRAIKNKKLLADENELSINNKEKIS